MELIVSLKMSFSWGCDLGYFRLHISLFVTRKLSHLVLRNTVLQVETGQYLGV
jgi:hypothetical protein